MVSVQELYELWAGESELGAELAQSLEPRGTDWLFDVFRSLGPQPGQLLVDVGARDARHTVRLVREHGLRGVALDPLPQHVELAREAVAAAGLGNELEVLEAAIESMPLPNGSADWIWCRDVLVHADVARGLAECARVLAPGGRLVAYVTLATDLLEPREAASLANGLALVPESLDPERVESSAEDAGLGLVEAIPLGGEWRERMIEDGAWDAGDALLRLSRLRRQEPELVAGFGAAAVDAYVGGQLWGVYQLLGKLCPTVYVWERRG
jgi:sarcosine/dimethylglycine N-methyltransferase